MDPASDCGDRENSEMDPTASDDQKKLVCDCGRSFALKRSLARHKKGCKKTTSKSAGLRAKSSVQLTCKCNNVYSSATALKKHQQTCDGKKKESSSGKSHKACLHPDCDKMFFHTRSMLQHLNEVHILDIKSEQLTFDSLPDFFRWKEGEELDRLAYFTQQSGKHSVRNSVYMYFICQDDGSGKPHRKQGELERKPTRTNAKGRVKRGNNCPARMLVKACRITGVVSVNYISSHSHELSLEKTQHHPVRAETECYIKQQISLGVPLKQIQERLLNDDSKAQSLRRRKQCLSLRTLREYQRKVKNQGKLLPDDAASTSSLVEKLVKEKYDPVLMYKPQNSPVVNGIESGDPFDDGGNLFLLGLQTREQLEMLKRRARHVTYVDVGCITRYNFCLVNVLVEDEFGKAYPVAHFLCSRNEERALYLFFLALKDRCPDLEFGTVMTDESSALIGVVRSLFACERHLLCWWHVRKDWLQKLHQMVSEKKLRDEMYDRLNRISNCETLDTFRGETDAFCKRYGDVAKSFVKFFEHRYVNRLETWTTCYRTFHQMKPNTSVSVEEFHRKLNVSYLKRKPGLRVCELVQVLLELEHEYFVRRETMFHGNNSDVNFPADESRHEKGMLITDARIRTLGDTKWTIDAFEIELASEDLVCSRHVCLERCMSLTCAGLCCHLYTCSCSEKTQICRHVHKIHAFRLRNHVNVSDETSTDNRELDADKELIHDESFFFDTATISVPEIVLTTEKNKDVIIVTNVDRDYDDKTSGVVICDTRRETDNTRNEIVTEIETNFMKVLQYLKQNGVSRDLLTDVKRISENLVEKCSLKDDEKLVGTENYPNNEIDENLTIERVDMCDASIKTLTENASKILLRSILPIDDACFDAKNLGERSDVQPYADETVPPLTVDSDNVLHVELMDANNSIVPVTFTDADLQVNKVVLTETECQNVHDDLNVSADPTKIITIILQPDPCKDGDAVPPEIILESCTQHHDAQNLGDISQLPLSLEHSSIFDAHEHSKSVNTSTSESQTIPMRETGAKLKEIKQETISFDETNAPTTMYVQVVGVKDAAVDDDESFEPRPAKRRRVRKSSYFTPCVSYSDGPNRTIFKLGHFNFTAAHFKSLEPTLDKETALRISSFYPHFMEGWLFDVVVDGFLHSLQNAFPHVLAADTVAMLSLLRGTIHSRLWSNVDVATKEIVLFPCKFDGNRWVLLVINVKQEKLLFLDPMGKKPSIDSHFLGVFHQLVQMHFQKDIGSWKWEVPSHTAHTDKRNGGILICWYAERVAKGEPLMHEIDTSAYRRYIYESIVGNCLKATRLAETDACRICNNTAPANNWIVCEQCSQGFHCECLRIDHNSASKLDYRFVCPADT